MDRQKSKSCSAEQHKHVKGLVCTELVEMSFSGRSDRAGLAGWGASVSQPFIGRSEQRHLGKMTTTEFPS